ncbi:MAG: ATP synthase F1 subunit delta [Lewinellaceae bacterium]|nr:ATP synthase F1 subunit delta [Lewinellaceae bacterium]
MSVTRIATRYAKSLLGLATEQNILEAVYSDVQQLQAAVENRELLLMLKSPIVHADKKNAVMEGLFKQRVDALTMAYIRLLILKGREIFLPEITSEFIAQYKVMKHITVVKVTSAAPLSPEVLNTLEQKLKESSTTFENIEIETSIDPKLIGGFVIQFDDKRFDASLSNKLKELKSEFNKNFYIKQF